MLRRVSHLDRATLEGLASATLSATDAGAAREHLAVCADCARALAEVGAAATTTRETVNLRGAAQVPRGPVSGPVPVVEKIGPYVLLELLGAGGMGAVYTAYHPELDRRVALKLLLPDAESSETPTSAQARPLR